MAANLDALKRERAVLRTSFSKCYTKILELSQSEEDVKDELSVQWGLLETRYQDITSKDLAISGIVCGVTTSDSTDVEKEQEKIDYYACMYYRAKSAVERALVKVQSDVSDRSNSVVEYGTSSRKYKLPTLKLREFGGELCEWLPFWSQFKKIDEDQELDDVDKLGYLTMSMTLGSSARQLVDSYPATGEMYVQVVTALKERFGRDDLLTEYYIRELLKLILQNTKEKLPISILHDRLMSHMRNLESLGVSSANCASILMPLVSSCLPGDLLQIWERNLTSRSKSTSKDCLESLLQFLKMEVEGAQKMEMAKSGFGIVDVTSSPKLRVGKKEIKESFVPVDQCKLPTAAVLVNASSTGKEPLCIFCTENHNSNDCRKVLNMTMKEKRHKLNAKRACYCCLRSGHMASRCRNRPKCSACGKGHYAVMCEQGRGSKSQNPSQSIAHVPSATLVSHDKLSKPCAVSMQTLLVFIIGANEVSRKARLLIDTGSQRSYIIANTAKEMGYNPLGSELLQHALFGGSTTSSQSHNVYRVYLSNLDHTYKCNFEALDQPKICGQISSIPDGPWVKELSSKNINLSDVGCSVDVEILVGSDIAGKLWTGRRIELCSGLVAMETRLGWTISGKIPGVKSIRTETCATVVTNLLIKDATIQDLWTLDTLGITDPVETLQRSEIEKATRDHFISTVSVNEDERFEVHLPFVSNHPPLSNNFQLSMKRLESTRKKLKADGYLQEYQKVLEGWEENGIIERVPPEELSKPAHYLPHHHVVKVSSTTPVRPVFDASAKDVSSGKCSLNQCLEKEPNLIEKIPTCLSRFRLKKVGVSGDIEKAFLQISVSPEDRDFLRFLWRDDKGQLRTYRHCRVVFGVSPSPFLLESCIQLHLQDVLSRYTQEKADYSIQHVRQLSESFYVDNCLTSLNNESEAQEFIQVASAVMKERKFVLRGWELSKE